MYRYFLEGQKQGYYQSQWSVIEHIQYLEKKFGAEWVRKTFEGKRITRIYGFGFHRDPTFMRIIRFLDGGIKLEKAEFPKV